MAKGVNSILRFTLILSVLTFISLLPVSAYSQTGLPGSIPSKPGVIKTSPVIKVRKPALASSSKIIIPRLKGIVFLNSLSEFNKAGAPESLMNGMHNGLYLSSTPVLNDSSFIKLISAYINRPLTLNGINKIISSARSFYDKKGYPFTDVAVPPQNVSGGVLQVIAVRYRVGRVSVTGNKYFSNGFIISQSDIKHNELLSKGSLISGIDWVNSNPFLHTNAVLSPGSSLGLTNVNLVTRDVFPLNVFFGFDNQGIPSLGMNEWNAGFNYGNMFGLGQMLSFQLTQSLNTRYRAYSLSYDIPFPWRGKIEFLGFYATASPRINQYFNELGRNSQASAYYKQKLPSASFGNLSLNQTAGLGYDFKTTNSNLAFGGIQVFNSTAQTDQFPVFYKLAETDPYGITKLNNRFVLSPGGFNPDNSTSAFKDIYSGTSASYVYDNLSLSRTQLLPFGFSLLSAADYQIANHNLLYSEQLAAGGMYSAPGYFADSALGSRGVMLNEQINLPPVNIAPVFQGTVAAYKNNPLPVYLSAFWDYADLSSVKNESSYTGLPDTSVLASIGGKLKADIGSNLSLNFALGWRLRSVPYGVYGKGLFEDIAVEARF